MLRLTEIQRTASIQTRRGFAFAASHQFHKISAEDIGRESEKKSPEPIGGGKQ
jgi:hypothetical protein